MITRFSGQLAGEADGGEHGGRIGEVFPGDGKGSAVVRAGAGLGQAEGDIHGGVEVEQLERNEALVVIHGEHGIELALGGVTENGIRHGGSAEGRSSELVQMVNGRADDADFLVAERAVLPGVGIESGDGDARVTDAAALEKSGGELADADDALDGEKLRHAGERFVNCGEADAEGGSSEEHAVVGHTEGVGEKLGLTGKGKPEGLQPFFGNRAGDDGVGRAVLHAAGGFVQGVERGGGRAGIGLAGDAGRAIADDFQVESGGDEWRGEGEIDDLGTDSGGIAKGDENARHFRSIGLQSAAAKRGKG